MFGAMRACSGCATNPFEALAWSKDEASPRKKARAESGSETDLSDAAPAPDETQPFSAPPEPAETQAAGGAAPEDGSETDLSE